MKRAWRGRVGIYLIAWVSIGPHRPLWLRCGTYCDLANALWAVAGIDCVVLVIVRRHPPPSSIHRRRFGHEQDVSSTIVCIVVRHRSGKQKMAIDPLSTVVATNKNIQITIDIHVRCGHRIRKCRRQNDGSAWRKATVPIITEDQHTTLQADDQILINI